MNPCAVASVLATAANTPWPGLTFNEFAPMLREIMPRVGEEAEIRHYDAACMARWEAQERGRNNVREGDLWNFLSFEADGRGQQWLDLHEVMRHSMPYREYRSRWANHELPPYLHFVASTP